jgi:zinc protease
VLAVIAVLGVSACSDDNPGPPEWPEPPEEPVTPLVFPDEPFRAVRPTPAMAATFQPPQPETFTLANGLRVILVERQTIPRVSWYLTFPGGSMMDPPGKEGLASLCLNVGFQATRNLMRQDREQQLADMGADVGLGVRTDDVVFGGEAPKAQLAATARLWTDLFLAPALTENDFSGTLRVRVNTLAGATSQAPSAIASRVSSRLFWGAQHPYNRTITVDSLQRITAAECRSLFAGFAGAMGAVLHVSGAVNRAELLAAFDRLVTLPAAGTMPAALPPAAPTPGTIFFVNAPAAPQSIITLRAPGPARTAPDYFAAELMADILAGDSVTSRIGVNVREMRGYAYSVGGGFSYVPGGSSFFLSAPVRTDATAESVSEILDELRKLREGGVTAEELTREQRGRVFGLPYQFETAAQILAEYDELDAFGLPFTYFDTVAQNFAAVTPAAAQQTAVQYLAPASLQILVVGDAALVLPKLRALVASHPDLLGSELKILDGAANPTAAP